MRKIVSGIYHEKQFPGVPVYIIVTDDGALLVDCPLYGEDIEELLETVSGYAKPRFLALLDSQPDRVLGAREIQLPIIAQDHTREHMLTWSDTFKGANNPLGGEADSIRRITGVKTAVPEITFSEEMILHLGSMEMRFLHQPGPTPGAMWVTLPEKQIVFIGDAIHISEPPFLGEAEIENWLEGLILLRDSYLKDWKVLSSRDGLVDRDDVTTMARFLRKVPLRVERLSEAEDSEAEADAIAEELLEDFKVPPAQAERMKLRLSAGLLHLTERLFPSEETEEDD